MQTIGIIGFGNMGSAIAERTKAKYKILVFDKDKNKTTDLGNINVAGNITGLLSKVDTVILAVKPQDFGLLLEEIKDYVKDKLVISIAAGITTDYIEKVLGKVRVVRVMPNIAAKVGKSVSCICKGKFANEQDLNFAKELFSNLGEVLILNEEMMDAATAISGSGPGYFYDLIEGKTIEEAKRYADETFIPSLLLSAESIGFNHQEALILANATTSGSMALLASSSLSAGELKRQVASKGGTTEAGLEVLHRGGTLQEAVKAALARARELSRRT